MEDQALRLYRSAVMALNERRWGVAAGIAQDLLRHFPAHAGLHFVAAVAAYERDEIDPALGHMQRACQLAPESADYAAQMARMLAGAHLVGEAVRHAARAEALGSQSPVTLGMLGMVHSRANDHGKALHAFERAVARAPDRPGLRYNLGTCLAWFGRMEEAEHEYRTVLSLDPRYWRAYLSLAHLRRRDAQDNDLAALNAARDTAGDDPEAALYLNLAMAKQLEDIGDYPAAFQCLVEGKAGPRRARAHAAARDREMFAAIQRAFRADASPVEGHLDDAPIFVVGMPRSGTTLVDRILSSHAGVHSAGELDSLPLAVKRMARTPTRDVVDAATLGAVAGMDWAALGREYVASVRSLIGDVPRFVDKLPHNFLYAGHIARALPHARIVCLRRDPMDTCLANFRQLFELSTPNYDYSFDLLDTGRYYLMFDRLMAHWQEVLPGRVHELHYEDLLRDQEDQTRRLLAFCGLDWDPACLAFEQNTAAVATASVAQVREPLTSRYVGRWRRYGMDMAPLAALLGVPMPA